MAEDREPTPADERLTDALLAGRPDPHEGSVRDSEREVRARLDCAVAALRRVDGEGRFGEGRDGLVLLLIDDSEWRDDRVLAVARRLNPPAALAIAERAFG